MAERTLTDAGIWISGYDLAGVSNSVTLNASVNLLDRSTFADKGWTKRAAGLKTSAFTLSGFFDTDGPDKEQFDSLGEERSVLVTPDGEDAGDLAYVVPVAVSAHETSGSIGELVAFSYAAEGDGKPERAQVFDIRETITASVTTPRLALGAIPAMQTLHVWVHVDQVAGVLEIDLFSAAAAMGGIVAVQGTQSNINGAGLYIFAIDGPVTDEHWFFVVTPTGMTPNAEIASASFFAAQQAIAIPIRPIIPPTPGTVTVKGGLSADAVPTASEITIDGVNHVIPFPVFTDMRVIIWRLESQGDITSVVLSNDPTRANQIGGWTKYASTVDIGGDTGSVWVSDQLLTFPTPIMLEVQ